MLFLNVCNICYQCNIYGYYIENQYMCYACCDEIIEIFDFPLLEIHSSPKSIIEDI